MEETQPKYPLDYDDMIRAGMHFGRKKTVFNPNMLPFIHTVKEHIYIFDLIKTNEYLEKATAFLKKMIEEGKNVLFVGLTKQSASSVQAIAEDLHMPYVINRWLGGTLTNFKTIMARVAFLDELEREQKAGGFEKYTKKERIMKERQIVVLKEKFGGIRTMTKIPDVVFLSSLKESQLPLREAKLMGVQTVAIVNTDSDPKQVTYPVPANDNSKKSVELILTSIKNNLIVS